MPIVWWPRLLLVTSVASGVGIYDPGHAIAEPGCTLCATRSRADGRAGIDTIPRAGTAGVTVLGAGERAAGEVATASVISMMFGLPMYTAGQVPKFV